MDIKLDILKLITLLHKFCYYAKLVAYPQIQN